MSRAKHSFWLDGGYDRDSVEGCLSHPVHDWWEFRVADVVEGWRDPHERMVICRRCYVPRCGHTTDVNPCMLPRHHRELHIYRDGQIEDVRNWPGAAKAPPPRAVIDALHGRPTTPTEET